MEKNVKSKGILSHIDPKTVKSSSNVVKTVVEMGPGAAFQADHQGFDGRVATHSLHTGDDGLGDVVAAGDAAEDVDEDGLHLGFSSKSLEF